MSCCCGDEPGTRQCCFTELMKDCYQFTLGGLADHDGDCQGGRCPNLNTQYQLNYVGTMFGGGCSYQSDAIGIGAACPGCGTAVRATMNVTGVGFAPFTQCRISIGISNAAGDDSCNKYSGSYSKVFDKATFNPNNGFTLDFQSAGTSCSGWPATISVSSCS